MTETVHRATARFSIGTGLSRITGLVREQLTAFYFGASPEIAAFFVAYRFALLFRRFLGEGAFLGGFVPYYTKAKGESAAQGSAFFRDFFLSTCLVAVGLVLLLEWGCTLVPSEVGGLAAWMIPGLFFVFLYMVFSALLQSEQSFFLPGAAPLMFNVVFIAMLTYTQSAVGLSIGVSLGFFAQWVLLWPSSRRFLVAVDWKRVKLFSTEVCQALRSLGLTFIGVGASQFNSALDALFARATSLSGPAYLHYASRLYQLPLSIVGVSFAVALLPVLSKKSGEEFDALLHRTILRSSALAIPMAVALLVLADPIMRLIYGHGDFQGEALLQSILCLQGYAVGLVPATLVLLMTSAYSARRDFKTPLYASLFAIGLNIFCNAAVVWGLEGESHWIALATSLAAYINWLYLTARWQGALHAPLMRPIVAICAASIFAGGGIVVAMRFYSGFIPLGILFCILLLLGAWVFKAGELLSIARRLLPRSKALPEVDQ